MGDQVDRQKQTPGTIILILSFVSSSDEVDGGG